MAQYTFDFRNAQNVDDLKLMLNKYFEWFFESLDYLNVKQLFTEYCNIQSENGETVLDGTQIVMKDGNAAIRLLLGLDKATGNFIYSLKDINGNETFSVSDLGQLKLGGRPLIEMYDNQAIPVLRLRMGFDSVANKFVFQMFDETGIETIGISASGKGVITGGTVRTAASGKRVELSSNSLKTYNASEQLEGLVFGEATGGQYGDVYLYDAGKKVLEFYNNLAGSGYSIRPVTDGTNESALFLGRINYNTYPEGIWNCSNANFPNLKDGSGQLYATRDYVDTKVTGATGSFTSADGKTVTVSNGLIVSIV